MQSRILIVDDNPKNIQVLANHLTNDDYEVEYASNGKEAVHLIEKEDFDLILLDVMMPGIDGFETCRRIKKIENKKHIPIIFVTAKTDLDSLTLGFEYGGVDYVSKPFKADELLLRVSTHIELKKTRDKLNYQNTFLEKKDSYYNEKLNTQHRDFLMKTKELENIIKMQSQLYEISCNIYNSSLNSITTPLSLLKLGNADQKAQKLVQDIENALVINKQTSTLLRHFNDYIGKRQAALKPSAISPEKLIGEALANVGEQIKSKNIDVIYNFQSTKEIKADQEILSFVLNTILGNACKFSEKLAKINISLFEESNALIIHVSDEGPGFVKEILFYPFSPVYKSENSAISLFMAKYLCDIHGIGIKLGNNPDKGAFVRVIIGQ